MKQNLRRLGLGILVVLAISAAVAIALPGRKAVAAGNGTIVGVGGKCLDNQGGRTGLNNPVQLWTCNPNASQQWSWTGDATIGVQGRCLDTKASATTSATPVVINSCSGAISQKWELQANGSITNSGSGLCLAAKNSSSKNGTITWLYACTGAKGEIWDITRAVVALPQTVPAAHGGLPSGTPHTAVPTINLVTYAAPEFASWLQTQIKPLLQKWYPVLADYYAYPDYTPSKTITIKVDPTYTGIAETSGTTITISTAYFRSNLSDAGALIHESTHVAQYNPAGVSNLPSWIVEGEADFSREHIYNDRAPRAAYATETYLDGYSPAANLLEFTRAHAAAQSNFVHSVNVAGWKGTYSDDLFRQAAGSSLAQLWTNMTGQIITNPGVITNGTSGKCFDLPNYNTADGTRIQIQSCNYSDAEKWVFAGTNQSVTTGIVKGYYGNKCLDVKGASTANGAYVRYYTCNYSAGQTWTRQPDGSLLNPHANKCLQPVQKADSDGTLLEIFTCDGTASQRWTLPPSSTPAT